jgi:deoxyribodipyrimidine photo-lyase
MIDRALVWFRRDLRDFDHAALAAALSSVRCVYCAFVFDTAILDRLTGRADRRVEFILESLKELDRSLRTNGGGLIVRHGNARTVIPALARTLDAAAVFVNRDYEPAAKARDAAVAKTLARDGIAFHEHKDQVIFERDEVLTRAGRPFGVYTPYRNAWLAALEPAHLLPHRPASGGKGTLARSARRERLPSLHDLGFEPTNLSKLPIATGMNGARRAFKSFLRRIDRYAETRNFPAINGTSMLSVHLRFGTVSIRTLASEAHARTLRGDTGAATWLSELIWRDFYFMVLDHRPDIVAHAYKREFDDIAYPNDRRRFRAWCDGKTGYPIVDAAMRQLKTIGWMHNRLRMVTASFLVKDLHIDWRWGERYFAANLNDYDLAANNGGWQWAASTGCDAQPYFRIFNPVTQSERFDPSGKFIRSYVPELSRVANARIHAPWTMTPGEQKTARITIGHDYPAPIVDHDVARKIALSLYRIKRKETA